MMDQIEVAKYEVDKVVFVLEDALNALGDALQFHFDNQGFRLGGTSTGQHPPPAYNGRTALIDFESSVLRSEVNLNPFYREAFIGLRLVVPVGD